MYSLPEQSESFWKSTTKAASYSPLTNDCDVDVAVVGGGISGILTAYVIAKTGLSVGLIEAREFASGTTGGTNAKLSTQHQLIYDQLMNESGKDIAKKYYQANDDGLRLLIDLIEEQQIDCDFEKTDAYVFARTEEETEQLQREAEVYKKLSINGEHTNDCPVGLDIQSALVMKNQAQFNPVKFSQAVLQLIDQMGGKIYQNTMVTDLKKHGDAIQLTTDKDCTVTCDHAVFATLFPTYDPDDFYSQHLQPMTSHLLALRYPKVFPGGMYISLDKEIRSFRYTKTNDENYLLVGGETHRTGDEKSTFERYQKLAEVAEKEFGVTDICAYWSEHDLVTKDRRPLIGYLDSEKENIYTITGLNKWGLTNAAAGAKLIRDLIMKHPNPYKEVFDPNHLRKKAEQEEKKNHSSLQTKLDRLENNQATTIEIEDQQIGLYKDQNGEVHYLDLACTHLGCGVHWNDADQTWDCPCHGSIFDATGKVVAGPALKDLEAIDLNEVSN